MNEIPCPFVYATGKACVGYIDRVAVFKADVEWTRGPDDAWSVDWSPRSHYHLFCSERGNHAGTKRNDDDRMKFFYRDLPEDVKRPVDATTVRQDRLTTPH
jgi:hypothetical protein